MKLSFWIKRFLLVLTGTFALLVGAALLRGRPLHQALTESGAWALIATSIFIAGQVYHSRRGEHCALCGDTPETARDQQCELKKK